MIPNKTLEEDPLLFAVLISTQCDFYPELASRTLKVDLPLGAAVYL